MPEQPPSHDQWLQLYKRANAFKMAHPWEWLVDLDIFGVRNPLTGEIGYCSIMGNLGRVFGMMMFSGPEGLAEYASLHSGEVVPESFEAIATLRGLSVTFEDRQMLSKRDLDVVRSLGLRFRGSNQWPWFRSHRPGYAPWYLTQDEAAFLSLALEQALEVAQRARDDPRTLRPPREGLILVRAPEGEGTERVWRDKWEPLVLAYYMPQPPKPVDELRLRRLRQAARGRARTWEMDIFLLPARVGERGERPYYPRCMMCVNSDNGMILDIHMHEPWLLLDEMQKRLLNLLDNAGVIPSQLDVASEEAYLVAESLAKGLDIRVRQRERLPSLEDAREAPFQFMR